MSVRIMSQVWDLALPSHLKLVLLAVADHADDEGYCYPGQARLAAKCGVSVRALRDSIRQLEAAGLLQVTQRGKTTTNLYRVVTGSPPPVTVESDRQPTAGGDRQPTAGVTGSPPPPNHQGTTRENRQQPPAARWAERWAELSGVPATRAVLRRWVPQVQAHLDAGGTVTEQLLARAVEEGIREPSGWAFVRTAPVGAPWPAWVVPHIVQACQRRDGPVDPRWEREFSFGPHSPVPPNKRPVLLAKQRALELARQGSPPDEGAVRQLLRSCFGEAT